MKKILLHACCAPCASYPIKLLIQDNYKPVVFFYNPNIYPLEEYNIRLNELKKYCENKEVTFFEGSYEKDEFYKAVKGFENEPEKGERCSKCFKLRLLKAANFAKENNIDCFTTTLTVSPHKNSIQIFEVGEKVQNETGINFIKYDFKKHDGFKISRQIAKEENMYAQKYCGCEFSIR